jgi:hypothetical protein
MEAAKPLRDSSWFTPYLRALEIARVPESKRLWYIRNVERFVVFLDGEELHTAERADAEAFISSLRAGDRIVDWQLRQAADAVRFLVTSVLVKSWRPSPDGAAEPRNAALAAIRQGGNNVPFPHGGGNGIRS